jgi:hypothetical protein
VQQIEVAEVARLTAVDPRLVLSLAPAAPCHRQRPLRPRRRLGVRTAAAVYCQASGEETPMALMLGKLYDALRAGGVPDGKAREAAEEVAADEKDLAEIKSDVRLLKWITGTTLAGVLALVLRVFTT